MIEHISHTDADTQAIAAALTAQTQAGDVVTLTGDLGAGKTTFTKGVAMALGVRKEIVSPTFTIMNVYDTAHPTIKKLVHIDTYRLQSLNELLGIGIEDFVGAPDTLSVIEWPEIASEFLRNKKVTAVTLAHNDNGSRTITVHQTKTGTT